MVDSRFFTNHGPFTVAALAAVTGTLVANTTDGERKIADVAPLDRATASDISFFDNVKYVEQFANSSAGVCFVRSKYAAQAPAGMVLLLSEDPYRCYALAAQQFYPTPTPATGLSPRATIAPSASLGEGVAVATGAVIGEHVTIGARSNIGANTVIADGVTIGEDCIIGPLTSISHSLIGNRAIIHRGVHIGQDGFGFAMGRDGHVKVPQLGRVVIGDDVEIGSGTTIDRGTGPDTQIGDGTKIDNLVQIGHNVQLGKRVIVVAFVGISGSTRIGDGAVIGGQAGIAGHLKIGAGARVAAQSGVMHDIPTGAAYGGTPAIPVLEWHRQTVAISRLTNQKEEPMSEAFSINPELISYDVNGIQRLLPHRYPFLMIDKVVNIVEGKSIVGIKNVSINEPYFAGHFPNHPVMPGVLIVEAMAQSAAVLVMHTMGATAYGKVVYFMSVEGSKFRKPVVPGDVLHIHCEAQKSRGNVWRFSGVAKVEGVKVAEAVYTAMIVDGKDD